MLKSLDILIGLATVMLLFSMAVTVVTQFITGVISSRGRYLRNGLMGLLQQLDPGLTEQLAKDISNALLRHPLIADPYGRLGTVIHREEFTTLLMELAGGQGKETLKKDAQDALLQLLQKNNISDPQETLSNIRDLALRLEAANPGIANNVRQNMAIMREAQSTLVGKVHACFDPTIDRVSQRFTLSTRWITLLASLAIAVAVQLDVIALVNRLSFDDSFRKTMVAEAQQILDANAPKFPQPPAATSTTAPATTSTTTGSEASTKPAAAGIAAVTGTASQDPGNLSDAQAERIRNESYTLLSNAGLITMPTNEQWFTQWDPRKIPGILLATLLLSLGAPFWYNALQKLLQLRSLLTQKDDKQREDRQKSLSSAAETAPQPGAGGAAPSAAPAAFSMLQGESGDLQAVG